MKKLTAILIAAALLCSLLAVAAFASPRDRDARIRFEGYVVGDGEGNNASSWIGFWGDDLTQTEQLGYLPGCLGAAYYNGNIYGYLYGYDNNGTLVTSYYVMDAETHEVAYPEGASANGEMVYGMAYNYANNTMYAMCDDNNTYIAAVDLTTGVLTKVVDVALGSYLGLQTFAIDGQGNFYALTFSALSARLVRIDISTGALTELFATGLPTYYGQSMTWDPQTNMIYWAQVDSATSSSNGLYKINVSAQSVTYMGKIGSNLEIMGLMVIPDYVEPDPTAEPTDEPDPTPGPTDEPQPTVLPGDADCNGTVDFADISLLYLYMLGQGELTAQGEINADYDSNGDINFGDISNIYMFVLGIS